MSDIHVALKDGNSVASAIFESSTSSGVILRGKIDEITGRVLVDNAGGGSFTILSATGTVNGTNAVFGFTSEPSVVVSDGAMYQATDNNSNVQWSWDGANVTMTIPPQSAIFGLS